MFLIVAMISSALSLRINSAASKIIRSRGGSFVGSSPSALFSSSLKAGPVKLKDASELLKKTDCFIFDCDGVIWRGDSVIDGYFLKLMTLHC